MSSLDPHDEYFFTAYRAAYPKHRAETIIYLAKHSVADEVWERLPSVARFEACHNARQVLWALHRCNNDEVDDATRQRSRHSAEAEIIRDQIELILGVE